MNIILADSHGPVMGKEQTSANLSLLYLASYVRQHRPDDNLKYLSQKPTARMHLQAIRDFEADVYAVGFTSYSALVTYDLIRQIREAYPDLLIVMGGVHVNTHWKEALERTGAPICVLGEGEQTFLEIIDSFDDLEAKLPEIKGLAYQRNGQAFRNPPRELIDDLDSIPFPARDLVNQKDFIGMALSKAKPNTELIGTRGCPLRCVFCANPVFRLKNGPSFRNRSPENIAEEVEQLYAMGYREIHLHSDELNVTLRWSIDVCKALAALGHKDLYFQCNLRVLPMSEELAYWMKQANFWMVKIGVETSSERVLKGIKKQMAFKNTERTLELLTSHGIKVFAFLLLFNYWEEKDEVVWETPEEVEKTISDMYRLWRRGHLHYATWAFPVPVQGAEGYEIARRHGMIDEDYFPSDTWDAWRYIDAVTEREFNRIYKKARRQTTLFALTAGNIEWRNYKRMARKGLVMLFGKPNSKQQPTADGKDDQRRG
jgi:anaerobic magnesium-protoporphyrin IX monomethyl ester cyclase